MKVGRTIRIVYFFCAAVVCAYAQESAQSGQGVEAGGYKVRQTVEFGARITGQSGNGALWNTFLDLHTGPRLLRQELEVHSLDHKGLLFDDLSMVNYGYGGDPNDFTRLRVSKNRWYNFTATFRRDRSYWDYDLLANPLNPPGSTPDRPALTSPHQLATVRRMADFSLKLAPQSRFRPRLAYSRHENEGPVFSTVHEGEFGNGIETILAESRRSLSDRYQFGFDWMLPHRTSLSFDQSFDVFKGDTSWRDRTFIDTLSNGSPVDLGVVFNDLFATCGPIFQPGTSTANEFCNGFLGYQRQAPVRSLFPASQLLVQSAAFAKLDLTARVMYSGGSSKVNNFQEAFDGLVFPDNLRQSRNDARTKSRRVLASADFGLVWHATDRLEVEDTFRFSNTRVPGVAFGLNTAFFADSLLVAPNTAVVVTPNSFAPANCPPPFTGAGCPQHSALSPPDYSAYRYDTFLGEDLKSNNLLLTYEIGRVGGVRAGYLYRNRRIVTRYAADSIETFFPTMAQRGDCFAGPVDANGVCRITVSAQEQERVEIGEHTLRLGGWVQPRDAWRTDADFEWFYADDAYTRLSPRQKQHLRLRSTYTPSTKLRLSVALDLHERRNGQVDVDNLEHDRRIGFTLTALPRKALSIDLSYQYEDLRARTLICVSSSNLPPGAVACPMGTALFAQTAFYDAQTHFAQAAAAWHPHKRVTANLGYTLTSQNGDNIFLNPLSPPGSLRYNWHQPAGAVSVLLNRGWTFRGEWGYHDYNEKGLAGPTAAREFHGNVGTLILRYAF